MATTGDGRGNGHAHIHSGHEHGHIRRVRRRYGHVRSGNEYGRGLPRGGGGKKNRSKRKEKRSRRKERDKPGTSVGWASRGARADATRGGDRVVQGRTRVRPAEE